MRLVVPGGHACCYLQSLRAFENSEAAVVLVKFHDAIVRDIAAEQISSFWEINGSFSPAYHGATCSNVLL